mgnify:CR=1 FL=1
MWASAPTNDLTKLHDFRGRTESSAPTKGVKPTRVRRKIAAFSILRRRGRCLHRPAESTYFMVVFRRNRVDFPSYAVGADDPVRPPELRVFTEIRCEFETFQWADVGIGPYERSRIIARFWRADRVVRPYKQPLKTMILYRPPLQMDVKYSMEASSRPSRPGAFFGSAVSL